MVLEERRDVEVAACDIRVVTCRPISYWKRLSRGILLRKEGGNVTKREGCKFLHAVRTWSGLGEDVEELVGWGLASNFGDETLSELEAIGMQLIEKLLTVVFN